MFRNLTIWSYNNRKCWHLIYIWSCTSPYRWACLWFTVPLLPCLFCNCSVRNWLRSSQRTSWLVKDGHGKAVSELLNQILLGNKLPTAVQSLQTQTNAPLGSAVLVSISFLQCSPPSFCSYFLNYSYWDHFPQLENLCKGLSEPQ